MLDNQKNVAEFADELSDAYSTDRYKNGWGSCIKMMRKRGLNDQQIEAIIRSKWTRWAGDASDNAYGQINSADLARFLDSETMASIESLTRESFGADYQTSEAK